MGAEGCSCAMYKRAKKAETENTQLLEKIEQLEAENGRLLKRIWYYSILLY
jgi:hypothetical protein